VAGPWIRRAAAQGFDRLTARHGEDARSPFDDRLGLVIDSATAEEVTAHLEVDPERHTQPMGMVHGGVYCAMVETLASLGASMSAHPDGRVAVGMENHTSFVRPTRGGTIRGVARPINRGGQTHLWEVTLSDDRRRIVARGSVRLALIEPRPQP